MRVHKLARETNRDHGFRWRITIATRPKRIGAADRGGKSVARPINIDRPGFAIVSGQNSQPRPLVCRQTVPHLSYRFDKISPADLFYQIAIVLGRERPPL